MRLVLIAIALNLGAVAYGAEPTPLPDNEKSWIHADCVNYVGEAGGGFHTTVMDTCRVRDGINKAEWHGFYSVRGEVFCRRGASDCEVPQPRGKSFRTIVEEFSCRGGRKDGRYKATIRETNLSDGIFGRRVEADYVRGRLHGTSRHFRSGGALCRTHEYKNGLLDGVSRYYGGRIGEKPLKEISFAAGLRHGKTVHYVASNNRVSSEENWDRGLRHGRAVRFSARDGRILSDENWERGKLQGSAVVVTGDGTRIENVYSAGKVVKRVETRPDGSVREFGPRELAQEEKAARQKLEEQAANAGPRLRPFAGLGLNLSATNDVRRREDETSRVTGFTPGAQLFLGAIRCQDIACGGWLGSVGMAKSVVSDEPAVFGEVGVGIVAMFVELYGGLGVRRDAGRIGAQATALLGFVLVGFYGRVIAWPDSRDLALEAGVQATIPFFKL